MRRSLVTATALLLALTLMPGVQAAEAADAQEGPKTDRWVVEFEAKADLGAAIKVRDRDARRQAVVNSLQATARRSQAAAIGLIRSTRDAQFEEFWMRNVLVVEGDEQLAEKLRRLPGVSAVRPEKAYRMLEPVEEGPTVTAVGGDPEWGVERVGAPSVWAQGITGAGVVVGSLDSGVQFDHPAIVGQYRGNNGDGTFDHNYNWFDAANVCATDDPCDELGHGTHTMGTMVGGDGLGPFAPDIGVAPGAQWMSVSCGPFFCTESQLMAAGEFFIAPTDLNGQNPDVTKSPDIINNSWGGGPGDPFFLDMVDTWRAAGIVPVFASGNPGPECGAGGSPGDYLSAYSVGATDINDVIAEFSGRGPSAFGKVNPNVSAPGVNVLSSVPGNAYAAFSGTSMATPHTVGTLALVMSSDVTLIGQVDAVTNIVSQTAMDIIDSSCGGDESGDPNNVYGDGRIDAAAAVAVAATGGTLTGTITDTETGLPIAGAKVTATGPYTASTVADEAGAYTMFLAEGTYDISASAFGYIAAVVNDVTVMMDEVTIQDLALEPAPRAVISGRLLTAENGSPVAGGTVQALGTPVAPVTTASDGAYELTLPVGSYTLEARLGGCLQPATAEVVLSADMNQNFSMTTKLSNFGHICKPTAFEWVDAPRPLRFPSNDDASRQVTLPFTFPFFGRSITQAWVDINGFVTFRQPRFSEFFNQAIPTANQPNLAVYGFWDDLILDSESQVSWGQVRTAAGRMIVFEYEDVLVLGTGNRVTFEMKLWDNGTIDLLYAQTKSARSGSAATIGIENGPGTDALQLGFNEPVAQEGTAWRISTTPIGKISGKVTDALDGLPVAGAAVTAEPSGRTAKTDANGRYRLSLIPTDYTLTASARYYEPATKNVTVRPGTRSVSFALNSARVQLEPLSLMHTVAFGETATEAVVISNAGLAPLEWAVAEQQTGYVPPDLPPAAELNALRDAANKPYAPRSRPPGAVAADAGSYAFSGTLVPIIEDPADDSQGTAEIVRVLGGADQESVAVQVEFTEDSPVDQILGIVHLDTDQDPNTGLSPGDYFGLPTQDIGFDYFVEMFNIHSPSNPTVAVWTADFEFVGEAPAEVTGNAISFEVPLSFFGAGEDGTMDVAVNTGVIGPEDWAPDVGHGTINPFTDVDWITPDVTSGTLAPGEQTTVNVTLGSAHELPGHYMGRIAVLTNDPRNTRVDVEVDLTVVPPNTFGTVSGVVTDAVNLEVLSKVSITVASELDGNPFPVSTETADDGTFKLVAPEGIWPVTMSKAGYVTSSGEVEIVGGFDRSFDAELTRDVGIISVSPESLSLVVAAGEQSTSAFEIANVGTQPFEFRIFENIVPNSASTLRTPSDNGPTYGPGLAWEPRSLPPGFKAQPSTAGFTAVEVIIDDPVGDAAGAVDITTVEAGVDGEVMTMRINTTLDSPADETVGFVFFDTDEDVATGLVPEDLSGLSTQEVGIDFFLDMFPVPDIGIAFLVSSETFEIVAEIPVDVQGTTFVFSIPLEAFGADEEGSMTTAMVLGDFFQPTDWAPDAGNGLIVPFEDAPWMNVTPASGLVDPGTSTAIEVVVDATGLEPGTYVVELRIRSDDPYHPTVVVPVTVEVMAA